MSRQLTFYVVADGGTDRLSCRLSNGPSIGLTLKSRSWNLNSRNVGVVFESS